MIKNQIKPNLTITKSPSVTDGGLGEIYQSMDLKMALLRPEGEGYIRITPFVKCRDFLTDVYTFSRMAPKRKFAIYGCQFDPKKEEVPTDGVYMELRFPSPNVKETFQQNLARLHEIEVHNNLVPTSTVDLGETTVTIGAAKWCANCLLFSLYTSILRLLCYPIREDGLLDKGTKGTDADLFNSVAPETWRRILMDLDSIRTEEFCGFSPQDNSTGTIHHNSGFYSVFGSHRELDSSLIKENKHWKHFKEQGWKLHTS